MESFKVSKTKNGLHVDGFPDAVKLIKLTGPDAARLADLQLHRVDLQAGLDYLEGINKMPDALLNLRLGLWKSAIVHFAKCFGHSKSRGRLTFDEVYACEPAVAKEVFDYFKTLRDKNIVHDENALMQCLPGAVLNPKSSNFKIAKIACLTIAGEVLGHENYGNLHKLITTALAWITKEFDKLCDEVTAKLEAEPYEALLGREPIVYNKPLLEAFAKSRAKP